MGHWMAIGIVVLALGTGACVPVDPSSPHERARALSSELMSPFCPGLLLSDCPSGYAAELRAEIERRLVAGESTSHITDDLAHRYGRDILGDPPATGLGLVFWIALIAAAAVSSVLVAYAVRRSSRRRADDAGARHVSRARARELAAKLDDELIELD